MTIDEIILKALEEDIGSGDHTSLSTIPAGVPGSSQLLIKEEGIIAGIQVAEKVFRALQKDIRFISHIKDGDTVMPGDIGFTVDADVRTLLSGERLALNILQRMSGIATLTARVVEKVKGLPVKILDTRKTTPLLRELEKMAVRTGGGYNHRMGLYDMIMIKDNHVDFAGGIDKAIMRVRHYLEVNHLELKIEIEVRNFEELGQVLVTGGIDRIMLDNFAPDNLRKAVQIIGGRYETEASGGINLDNIHSFAETGVDFISVGALTHRFRSLDMSLKAVS